MAQSSDNSWDGISEQRLDNLMVDILEYAERTNHILNDISDLIMSTSSYFDCESGAKFREQFNITKSSFMAVNKNILGYNLDLLQVKSNYSSKLDCAVANLKEGQQGINSRMEKKEE